MSPAQQAPQRTRPWHLSDAHLLRPNDDESVTTDPARPASVPREGEDVLVTAAASNANFDPALGDGELTADGEPLAPLWRRVVTGQSFGWRIRVQIKRFIRLRRRVALRLLRWIRIRPDVRQALSRGRISPAIKALRAQTRESQAAPEIRGCVDVYVDVDVRAHDHALVSGVRLAPASAATPPSSTAPVVLVRGSQQGGTTIDISADLLSLERPGRDAVQILGPANLATWKPVGFPQKYARDIPDAGDILAVDVDDHRAERRLLRARKLKAVRCSADLDGPSEVVARQLGDLALTGVPLYGDIPDGVATLLGADLSDVIRGSDGESGGEHAREIRSIEMRRAALNTFSPRSTWRRIGERLDIAVDTVPHIAVLLPSNRPGDVLEAVSRVASQRHVRVQLIVGLHGEHMPADLDAGIVQAFDGDVRIVRLSDALNLGQVMNALTEHVDAPLLSKWDDDDWYDPFHLADLVQALEYSGATLVGKGGEFVYLEALDLTVRRFAAGAETFSTTIAGSTLTAATSDIRKIGWTDAPKRVDRLLIEDMTAAGMSIYRTHGFGYMFRRRSTAMDQHTWKVGDAYFVKQARAQRSGLDLAYAGFASEEAP